HCAEQGVSDCMQQGVGIRMTEQALGMRYGHAAQYQWAILDQRVAIVTLTYTEWGEHGNSHPFKYSSARATSSGKVTLKLRGLPCTSRGCKPSASIALASSVTCAASCRAFDSSA